MKTIDELNIDHAGRRALMLYCYRQAAINFEAADRYREAAECWEEAGEVDRAVALLLQQEDSAMAARLLWKRERYREALDCYERWLERSATDVTGAVQAHLGVAACCDRLDEAAERGRLHYWQARATLEGADLPALPRSECWRAVGEYGSRVDRWDLVHLGYEQALRQFARDRRTLPGLLREYLAAIPGNRLLRERLQEQLAECDAPGGPPKPHGEALRAAAEQIREVRRFKGNVRSLSCPADGRLLASGGLDQTVRLWDPHTGEELRCFRGHENSVLSVSFSADGRLLASGSDDQTVRLWNPYTGEELRCLREHKGAVLSVSFSADGRLLASGGSDQTVRLWNPHTGEELHCLRGHENDVRAVTFSADGRLLASGGHDGNVRLWNPETGQELRCLQGHRSLVNSVSFSVCGRLLASGSTDGTVRLWNTDTGEQMRLLEESARQVWRVAFSPDGRILVEAPTGNPMRIWEVASWNCIATVHRESDVGDLVFSSDGMFLVVGSSPVEMWDVSSLQCGPEP